MAVNMSKSLLKKYNLYISWKRYPFRFIKFKIGRYIKELLRKRKAAEILANKSLPDSKNEVAIKLGKGLSENSITKKAKHLMQYFVLEIHFI